jgi:O-methyltransferase
MNADDLATLKIKLREAVVARPPGAKVAIVGWTPAAFEVASDPVFSTGAAVLSGIFVPGTPAERASIKRLDAITPAKPDIVVIADDVGKEPAGSCRGPPSR